VAASFFGASLRLLALCAGAVVVPPGLARATAAPAAPPRAFREGLEAAVGTELGLLVVTRSGVTVVDPNGKAIGTLVAVHDSPAPAAADRGPGARRAARAPAPAGWPGLTADADYSGGVYDPDDIDDGDDPRLTDDGGARPWEIDEPDRRLRTTGIAARAGAPPSIAAAGATGWVVRADGIWRIDLRSGAGTRAHPPPRASVRGVAAGLTGRHGADVSVLAVLDGDDLLVSSGAATHLQRVAGAAIALRKVVVGPAGTILGLERGGHLRTVAAPGTSAGRSLYAGVVEDVVGCDGGALFLAEETIFQVSARTDDAGVATGRLPGVTVARVGRAPPGAERLACGAIGAGWAAFGTSLHVSGDGGRTWRERRVPSSRPLRALIPTRGALWIGSPSGLWPLLPAVADGPAPLREPDAVPRAALIRGAADERLRTPSAFWWRWAGWLPVVDVEFEVGRVGPIRDVRGLVCASFRLDGPLTNPPPRIRRRTRSRSEDGYAGVAELEALTARDVDLIAVEERRALARILEEPP
jgi:hypothetical protein